MSTMQTVPSTQPLQEANVEQYDLVILGGGTGGTIAAWTVASQGQRVAVIEHRLLAQQERHP
jgi:choline dehydrogenase-like flavoprotein